MVKFIAPEEYSLSIVDYSTIPPIGCNTNKSSSICSAGLDNLLTNLVDTKE